MSSQIRDKALQLLSWREHSRQELQHKLLLRGYALSAVRLILDEFAAKNLQSEMRFAAAYIYSRSSRGYGPERIRLALQQKGISASMIASAMANAEVDWSALAQTVYQKKYGHHPAQDFREKIKRQQFMRYRGFKIEYTK